jgi:hypothetical protein
VIVKPLDDLEEVAAGIDFVADDDRAQARIADRSVVEPCSRVGAHAHLPRLQDDNTHPAGLRLLLLDQFMEFELCGIERERH